MNSTAHNAPAQGLEHRSVFLLTWPLDQDNPGLAVAHGWGIDVEQWWAPEHLLCTAPGTPVPSQSGFLVNKRLKIYFKTSTATRQQKSWCTTLLCKKYSRLKNPRKIQTTKQTTAKLSSFYMSSFKLFYHSFLCPYIEETACWFSHNQERSQQQGQAALQSCIF